MTLAEFAEREAEKLRADGRSPGLLAAYNKRPPCPLTPVVLSLISGIAQVDVDCGWHMVAIAYQIKIRRVIDDKEYGIDRLLSGLPLSEAYFATALWARETVLAIDEVRRAAGLGPLSRDRRQFVQLRIESESEQAKVQTQEIATP